MRVELKASNYDRKHSFNVIMRPNELLLTTPDGKEIASIVIETMEKDSIQADGKFATEPTNNFFVWFRPADTTCGRDVAHAWVEAIGELAL